MSARDFLQVAVLALAATGCCFLGVVSQTVEQKVFSCEGRPNGYYADVSSGCQIYHMCDGLGRQFSYSCPNTTLFQQRMLICDHWYMVNCSKAELDYGANLLIGQKGKPFVEDGGDNPYHRTPRPDLLAHPSAAEFNIIYRTGRAQGTNSKNLVGADKYEVPKDANTPAYFLPSHWSTEYAKGSTEKAVFKVKSSKGDYKKISKNEEAGFSGSFKVNQSKFSPPANFKKGETNFFNKKEDSRSAPANFKEGETHFSNKKEDSRSPPANFKKLETNFSNQKEDSRSPPANFKKGETNFSNIKDDSRSPPANFKKGETHFSNKKGDSRSPPANFKKGEINFNFSNKKEDSLSPPGNFNPVVNFRSDFKATTPVYPRIPPAEAPLIQDDSQRAQLSKILLPPLGDRGVNTFKDEIVVNFPSDFKATTPVYPKIAPPEATEGFIPEEINAQLAPPKKQDAGTFGFSNGFNSNTRKSEETFSSDPRIINFASNFKATTPVYPLSVTPETPLAFEEIPLLNESKTYGLSSIIEPPKLPNQKFDFAKPVKVNFRSDFKATTPVYPKFVTPETPLAIQEPAVEPNRPVLSTVIQPPKSYIENSLKEPSVYYQPPLPARKDDFRNSNGQRNTGNTKNLNQNDFRTGDRNQNDNFSTRDRNQNDHFSTEERNQNDNFSTRDRNQNDNYSQNRLEELRKLFLIPDYEFPLDSSAVRPSYDQGPNSFQVNPFSHDLTPRKHA